MLFEPVEGHLAQPFGTSGQPDDLVLAAQVGDEQLALGEHRVGAGLGEESVPFVAVQVMESVPNIGHDAVDVEDREHTRHPSSPTRITSLCASSTRLRSSS